MPDRVGSQVRGITPSLGEGERNESCSIDTMTGSSSSSFPSLRNNRLKDLPPQLQSCTHLRDIILSYNLLPLLPPVLYRLPSLENILANDNQIDCIDVAGLKGLPALSSLDLHNNSIASVPPELGTLTSIRLAHRGLLFLIPTLPSPPPPSQAP